MTVPTRRLDEALAYWVEHTTQLTHERDEAVALLRTFADPGPCHHDHHGHCQAHGWLDEDECHQKRLADFMARQADCDGDPRPPAHEEQWRFSGDLTAAAVNGPFTPPEATEWRAGDPEPPADTVQAVRGHRTQRIYFRETPAPGGRWIHRQSGDWCRWDYLLHFEQSAHLYSLGGGDG